MILHLTNQSKLQQKQEQTRHFYETLPYLHTVGICVSEREKTRLTEISGLVLYVLSEEEPRKLTLILWLELSTPICKERTFCFAPSLDEKWIMLLSHFQTPISQLFASFLSLKSFFFQISITSSFSLVLCSLSFTVSLFHSSTLFRWLHLSLSHSSALLTSR